MHLFSSSITSKGQVTIPKMIRDRFELNTGDKVAFSCNENNEIVLRPATKKSTEVAGMLSQYKKVRPVSVDEMHVGIQQQMNKRFT